MGVLSHRLNAIWSIAGNATYALGQWLVIVVLARSAPLSEVGQFALALAVTAPVFMASNMRLRMVLASDTAQKHSLEVYLFTRIAASLLAVLFAAILGLVSVSDRHLKVLIIIIATAKAVEAVQDMLIGSFQLRERMDRAAFSMIASSVISVSLFAASYRLSRDLLIACGSLVIARCVVLLAHDLPRSGVVAALRSAPVIDRQPIAGQIAAITLICWPLGVAALLDSLTVNLPRIFIGGADGERQLGAFAAVIHIAMAGFVVVNAVGQSLMPRLAQHGTSSDVATMDRSIRRLLMLSTVVGGGGVLISGCLGEWLLQLIYGPALAGYGLLLVLVMAGATFSYMALVLVLFLTAVGQRAVQMQLYLANIVVASVGCVLLMPRLGLNGVAIAVLLGHAMQAALCMVQIMQLRRARLRSA